MACPDFLESDPEPDEPACINDTSDGKSDETLLEQLLKQKLPQYVSSKYEPKEIDYLARYLTIMSLQKHFDTMEVRRHLEKEFTFEDDSMIEKLASLLAHCSNELGHADLVAVESTSSVAAPEPPSIVAKKMPRKKQAAHIEREARDDSPPLVAATTASFAASVKATSFDDLIGGVTNGPQTHGRNFSRSPRRNLGSLENLSRGLVRILRHRTRENVDMTDDGFAPIAKVLYAIQATTSKSYCQDDVRRVVSRSFHSDGAPRFETRDGESPSPWIRATRYHSIMVRMQPSVNMRRLSDELCIILRQEARHHNILICADGFAPVDDVLAALRRFVATREDINSVVQTSLHSDGSPCFEMQVCRNNGTRIRATRKHMMRSIG